MTDLVLASASPARRATLAAAGVHALVRVSGVDEPAVTARAGVTAPVDVVRLLARAKAEDVAIRGDAVPEVSLVLGCDSVLDLDGEPLGKPRDAAEAVTRWKAMRGRSGVLHTGHCLIDVRPPAAGGTGRTLDAVASTEVYFADVSDEEIQAYVATGEPLQVAGAFTVDGLGGAFVAEVRGDHHNVVGVSLPLLRDLLGRVGVCWTDLWPAAQDSSSD